MRSPLNSPQGGRAPAYEPIAVIGMGCRFPGAPDLDTFWENLRGRRDCITEVTADRWNVRSYYDPERGRPGRSDSKWAGLVDTLEEFDAAFFGISSREAMSIDPQQRWLLEMAWRALEDAGQPVEPARGTPTGVFVGLTTNDYATLQGTGESTEVDAHFVTGCAPSIAANRISYCLNLKGPSLCVDTACSSSLVAVHLACQALQRRECTTAIAAGVNVITSPLPFIAFASIGMLSPQGRCKAFDATADGFVRGEGAGAVLLKPLSTALADGDRIYAVIRGTGVNQDGRTPGMMTPNQDSQEELVREVCQVAGVPPSAIHYIEAHGTGTAIGDPIEASALGRALNADGARTEPCWIGSVKTNIGHLEAGAGMAGLIKVVLALQRGEIPASLHFHQPNPAIDFEGLRLRVAAEPVTLAPGAVYAGINSFGWGGTNAHALLAGAPPIPPAGRAPRRARCTLLPLSARTPAALAAVVQAALRRINASPTVAPETAEEVCRAAALRRTHFEQRIAVVGTTAAELAGQLQRAAAGGNAAPAKRAAGVAFVFCGQGPQWWGMGRELYRQEPAFRTEVDAIAEEVRRLAGWSLADELRAPEKKSRIGEMRFAQPLLFALQSGLAALWRSWGIEPACVVGHSLGEIAAAYVAGALSRAAAVRVVCVRAELMGTLPAAGGMLAVGLSPEDAARHLADYPRSAWIAAFNSPRMVTLAGEPAALREIEAALIRRQVFARFVRVQHAFHSPHMDPIERELCAQLGGIAPRAPAIPLFSTVTGTPIEGAALGAGHWWRNVRQPVQFSAAIEGLRALGHPCCLELGPHPVLGSAIRECLPDPETVILPSLRRGAPARETLLGSLGQLYQRGCDPLWRAVFPRGNPWVALPSYPLQRDKFWKEPPRARAMRLAGIPHPLLGQRQPAADPCWEFVADLRLFPYLSDHRVNGHVVFPAAAFLEVALAAAREIFGPGGYVLQDVEILKAMFLVPDDKTFVQISVTAENLFAIRSQARSANGWTTHVTGSMRRLAQPAPVVRLAPARARCHRTGVGSELYALMADGGLQHGPLFQGIERYWHREREVVARIRMPAEIARETAAYLIHPAHLDACFQPGFAALPVNAFGGEIGTVLPVRVDRLNFYASPRAAGWVHGRIHEMERRRCMGDMRLLDGAGRAQVEVLGLRHVFLEGGNPNLHDAFYALTWQPQPLAAAPVATPEVVPANVALAVAVEATRRTACPREGRPSVSLARPPRDAASLATAGRAHREWREERQLDALALAILRRAIRSRPRGARARQLVALLKSLAREPRPAGSRLHAWPQLLERMPGRSAELLLLERCQRHLDALLAGRPAAQALLFGASTLEGWDQLWSDAPQFRAAHDRIRELVGEAVRATPAGFRLRVLELDGGTGALARRILPYVDPSRIDYVFTDPRPECVRDFQRRNGELRGVRSAVFDARRSGGRDPAIGAHELVIVAPSGPGLDAALARGIRAVLVPGGWLIAPRLPTRPGWLQVLETLAGRAPRARVELAHWIKTAGCVEGRVDGPLLLARAPLDRNGRGNATDGVQSPRHTAHLVTSTAAPPRRWLIAGPDCRLARELAETLRQQGQGVHALTWPDVSGRRGEPSPDLALVIENAWRDFAGSPGPRGIVHLQVRDEAARGWTADSLMAAQAHGSFALLALAQRAQADERAEPVPLFVVTRGAQCIEPADIAPDLAAASSIGLARVIRNEVPRLGGRLIDLDPAGGPGEPEVLAAELHADDREQEVAWRGTVRYAQRFGRQPLRPAVAAPVILRPGANARLTLARPGMPDQLVLEPAPRLKLGDEDVRIRVEAAGLNFRDVMKALGLYPGAEDPPLFGDECAGVVTQVGAKVPHVRVGDPVIALARGALATEAIANHRLVFRKPAAVSFEGAATLLVAYLTAHYSLHGLGRLQRGERVLIHAAAGGVGLAAVRLAQSAGAIVFATAGSEAKREFLRSCGVRQVFDSRSLAFADQIAAITGARGLDVVLNSLAGDAIERSLALLGPGGRFLEIGRRDIHLNRRLGLRPFANNLAYFAVDLGRLIEGTRMPGGAATLRALQAGQLTPLPYRAFPLTEAAAAFTHMSQARQIGKIVLCPRAAPLVVTRRHGTARLEFNRRATYLITGGLDGFGAVVARSLVLKGARHLVLMSRRGRTTPGARELLADLRQTGAEPVVMRGDVSCAADVRRVLREIRRRLPPLRGIVHAAGVIYDGLLPDLGEQRFRTVMASKVTGAWLLHEHTQHEPLDFFVLFSSAAAVLGSVGQGNYAAANAFMDALAHYRRARGLPAIAINWGMLNDVGFVARSPRLQKLFSQLGWAGFSSRHAIQLLAQIMAANPVQITAAKIDWASATERLAAWPRYGALFAGGLSHNGDRERAAGWIREQLNDCPPGQAQALLEKFLVAEVARALRIGPVEISAAKPLTELGLDSLMIVELVTRIERQLGTPIPSGRLVGSSSIARLAEVMVQVLRPAAAAVAAPAPTPAASLAWVSDAQLEPQLRFDAPLVDAERRARPERVLLTACTDFLSVFVLRDLLARTSAEICCLAPASDADALRRGLAAEFQRFGLHGDLARVTLVRGELGAPRFGLGAADFAALGASIDAIHHTGALVNHVSPYARLRAANVGSVNTVLQLATHGRRKPVHYVSSVALLSAGRGAAPVTEDCALALPERLLGGYAQTRWAAEKILLQAHSRGLPVTLFRPGLLTGPVDTGEPGPEHFVWSMLRQCLQLGCGPDVAVDTLLTPVDFVSEGIVRLSCAPDRASQIFHLINPQGGTVAELVRAARSFGYALRLVEPAEWEGQLVAASRGSGATRLLPYYIMLPRDGRRTIEFHDLPEIDSRATHARLGAIGLACPPIDQRAVHRFLEAMAARGFIPPPAKARSASHAAATAAGGGA